MYTHGGRQKTEWEVTAWAKEAVSRGAGEILLTSMDADGEKTGFNHTLTQLVTRAVPVPVIASGEPAARAIYLKPSRSVKRTPRLQLPFSITKRHL